MRTNALSAFGRMGYGAHLAVYPGIVGFTYFVVLPWYKASNTKLRQSIRQGIHSKTHSYTFFIDDEWFYVSISMQLRLL